MALLAGDDARERSHHFSYEMVALTPATCRELGFPVSAEDEGKPYLEVSGRKGLGVKADDLLEALQSKALDEVRLRNGELPEDEQDALLFRYCRGYSLEAVGEELGVTRKVASRLLRQGMSTLRAKLKELA